LQKSIFNMNYDFLIDLEKQLLQLKFRKNKAALESILHPDFFEFGSSGTQWDRATTIESLTKEEATSYPASDFLAHPISDDVILITYTTERNGQKELRSSLWKKSDDAWKLFFHQGTKTA
jgi:hypothetical protein